MFLRFLWKYYKAIRIFLGIGGIKPYKMELDILEENDDYITLNKPAGVLVHPTKRNDPDTLLNGVLYYLNNKNIISTKSDSKKTSSLRGATATKQSIATYHLIRGLLRQSLSLLPRNNKSVSKKSDRKNPGPIQRLDRDTSGIVLFALSDKAKSELGIMMMNKKFKKIYTVLVAGHPKKQGEIHAPLSKITIEGAPQGFQKPRMQVDETEGKEAITKYRLLKYFKKENVSLVSVELITGKMHQIRVHFAHIGHPVVGDILYGNENINKTFLEKYMLDRQFLHAAEFSFHSKIFGEKTFISALPKELDNVIKDLKQNKLS